MDPIVKKRIQGFPTSIDHMSEEMLTRVRSFPTTDEGFIKKFKRSESLNLSTCICMRSYFRCLSRVNSFAHCHFFSPCSLDKTKRSERSWCLATFVHCVERELSHRVSVTARIFVFARSSSSVPVTFSVGLPTFREIRFWWGLLQKKTKVQCSARNLFVSNRAGIILDRDQNVIRFHP